MSTACTHVAHVSLVRVIENYRLLYGRKWWLRRDRPYSANQSSFKAQSNFLNICMKELSALGKKDLASPRDFQRSVSLLKFTFTLTETSPSAMSSKFPIFHSALVPFYPCILATLQVFNWLFSTLGGFMFQVTVTHKSVEMPLIRHTLSIGTYVRQ